MKSHYSVYKIIFHEIVKLVTFINEEFVFINKLGFCFCHLQVNNFVLTSYLWLPYVIGQTIYIFILSFVVVLLLSFFPRLISAATD